MLSPPLVFGLSPEAEIAVITVLIYLIFLALLSLLAWLEEKYSVPNPIPAPDFDRDDDSE